MTTAGQDNDDPLKKVGAFFRRSSTAVKRKFEDTKIKDGAKDLGKSIADTSKKTGKEVKQGFLRFATKVKGIFKAKETPKEEETKVAKFKSSKRHDRQKKKLMGRESTDEDDDDEPIPEMLKLEGHSEDDDDDDEPWHHAEE